MSLDVSLINAIGAACFGSVIGWCIYYSMRRWEKYSPSQLGVLLTAVLGGVVVAFFVGSYSAGAYGIGVAIGFFAFAYWANKHGHAIFLVGDRDRSSSGVSEEAPPGVFKDDSK
jgi:NhaP-type Na+/H+ or K+/H+ antiporter